MAMPWFALANSGPNSETPDEKPSQSNATFKTEAHYVVTDAFVTDRDGHPVPGLDLDDFEIYEDGVKQSLQSVQFIRTDTPDAPPRLFVIFMDDYHVQFGHGLQAQNALINFIKNDLRPTDLVGIMFPLTPIDNVSPTQNHQAVIRAIESFQGVRFNYTVRNTYEARYNSLPTEVVEQIRNEVSLSALVSLAEKMDILSQGYKAILLVSEGYTNYVPPHLRHTSADMAMDTEESIYSDNLGLGIREETHILTQESIVFRELGQVAKAAKQANTSIYAFDPSGIGGATTATSRQVKRFSQNSLRRLAQDTDGEAIVNRNGAQQKLRNMLQSFGDYYLLGHYSSVSPDGKFHNIEVKVKRRGLSVRARKGYWSASQSDLRREFLAGEKSRNIPEIVSNALKSLAKKMVRGMLVHTWWGVFPKESGDRGQVRFIWELNRDLPEDRQRVSRLHLTATNEETKDVYFEDYVDDPNSSPPLQFDALPGTLHVEVKTEDQNGRVLDRNEEDIAVPNFKTLHLVLGTPFFVHAHNDFQLRNLAGNWDAPPVMVPNFSKKDHLLVRFSVYSPEGGPDIQVGLLGRDGKEILESLGEPVYAGETYRRYQLKLVPSFLAHGEYIIEIQAKWGEWEDTKMLAFRIHR